MRTRERNNPEVPRLMRTLFADLYPVRKLLIDHHELLKPAGEPGQKPGITEAVVMDVSVSQHLHPTRPEPHLWSGMILQAKGDLAGAAAAYNASAALAAPYDWQGSCRLWRALLLLGDGAAAAREEAALRRRWGATRRCDGTAQTLMVTYCPPRRSERRCPCRILDVFYTNTLLRSFGDTRLLAPRLLATSRVTLYVPCSVIRI
mmetsp:Transcript_14189/g.45801  ORF Transcript_14189/g.45801 Transcript_14189/m.45801 type:complete len:204 (+) Transcript_14189:249-860(+)